MDSLPIALTLAARGTAQEALSALPSAPVVAHVDTVPVAVRTRRVVAFALRHLADVVAPPLPMGHRTGRLKVDQRTG
jgi:hypothetical protein